MERQRFGGGGASSGGGYASTGGGYSRRCMPGDPKSNDRHRLLTDRTAYISFLEAQAERGDDVSAGLSSVRSRMDELEEKIRSSTKTVELIQDSNYQTNEASRAGRMAIEDQIRIIDGRVQRLEHSAGERNGTIEAEMARSRNEVALVVQELSQRVDDRMQGLRAWLFDEGASGVIREAQATCVRLADDALGAVEQLTRRTEASLEVLRVDVTSLRAELAGKGLTPRQGYHTSTSLAAGVQGHTGGLQSGSSASGSGGLPVMSVDVARYAGDDASAAIADTVERRLGQRLGHQVLQLSEVLRRVVQAQATLHQQLSGGTSARAASLLSSRDSAHPTPLSHSQVPPAQPASAPLSSPGPQLIPTQAVDFNNSSKFSPALSSSLQAPGTAMAANNMQADVIGDAQRRVAIDELYAELRRLEDCDKAMRRSASASASPGPASVRRSRSSRTTRSAS